MGSSGGVAQQVAIADGAVTNAKLAADAVTTDKVLDGTLTGADLAATIAGAKTFSALVTAGLGLAITDGQDLTVGTGTGSKVGQATSKLGFFGATPVVRPARAGQITDSSGGTSGAGTIAVIRGAVDPTAALLADTANAIATLAARLNQIETIVHNLGLSA